MKLTKDKKEMLIEVIAVRLDNINDVTRRSRLAFLITTIASSAIIVTIWGVYISTARIVALYEENQNASVQVALPQDQNTNNETTSPQPNNSQINLNLPLHEFNRRELIKEWIKSTNVSIDLLGVEVNINDFPIIGSLGLFIICFWLFFTFRRENRAIVSLLRDVRNDINFPEASKKKGDDVWDIANLVFHGVANSLIFFTTGTNDRPLSGKDIFEDSEVSQVKDDPFSRKELLWRRKLKRERRSDIFVSGFTRLIRGLAAGLIFLPALTIFFIITMDFYSSHYIKSPFRAEKVGETYQNLKPADYLKKNGMSDSQITIENGVATLTGTLTLLICVGCFIFQKRTSDSLKEFEGKLRNENKQDNEENNLNQISQNSISPEDANIETKEEEK